MLIPDPICLELLMQVVVRALSRALFKAGSSMAASMAMIAITIKSSISVNERMVLLSRDPLNWLFLFLLMISSSR